MTTTTTPTWDDVTDELTGRLPRLRDGDAILIKVGEHRVQFKRFGGDLLVIASSAAASLPEEARLSADQARRMLALGWQPPGDELTHSLPDLHGPISAATARRVAGLLVASLRDVFGAATPAAAVFTSFNDEGQRAPTLSTVAMSPEQRPEVRVSPATLLPAPARDWQDCLEAVLAGVGGWSRAEIEALYASRGWEITRDDDFWGLRASGGALEASASPARTGHGFESVEVRERVPATASAARFREVLAAAVAVLGDPPIVGGRGPFARWRGTPLTVIVSRDAFGDDAFIALKVTPTEAIDNDEYHRAEYDDHWQPEHLWTTWPDTDAPEHGTLDGMMWWPRRPAADLDELGRDLRELFKSFAADLPVLVPYASSACFRIHGPRWEWLADGEFTPDRARVWAGSPEEWLPLDGADTGAAVAARVMSALVEAGIGPDRLRGSAWSATPAERLSADGLTVPRR